MASTHAGQQVNVVTSDIFFYRFLTLHRRAAASCFCVAAKVEGEARCYSLVQNRFYSDASQVRVGHDSRALDYVHVQLDM